MKFEQLIKDRYSCRKFKNTPVEKEKIEKILEAALVAPTACNLQPQRILVLTDKNIIKALDDEKCTRYTFAAAFLIYLYSELCARILKAPSNVFLVHCKDKSKMLRQNLQKTNFW